MTMPTLVTAYRIIDQHSAVDRVKERPAGEGVAPERAVLALIVSRIIQAIDHGERDLVVALTEIVARWPGKPFGANGFLVESLLRSASR
jgi:hypothetical protein